MTARAGKKTQSVLYGCMDETVMMFISGFLICAAGPGAIPSLAIIPVLAVPIARSSGLNPILLCLAGQMGVQAGRMSPITPEAAVVLQLMSDQGLAASSMGTMPILYCMLFTEILLFACCFLYFKGWKVSEPDADAPEDGELTFSSDQFVTLGGLVVMLVCVLVLKMNVGLTSFLVGSVLIALGYGYEKTVVKGIPWDVILMVLGVGMLMQVMMMSGGVDVLSAALSSLMTSSTAAAVMVTTAGILSFFSSGLGVVFPTLIPTASRIAASLPGVNPVELVAMIVIGGTVTGFSPVSTAGALIMSAVSVDGDEKRKNEGNQNILFRDLFVVAFFALIISAVASMFGVYLLFL